MDDLDTRVRLKAFSFIEELSFAHRNALPRELLATGYGLVVLAACEQDCAIWKRQRLVDSDLVTALGGWTSSFGHDLINQS
jgi:hypothetical protein